MALWDKEYLKLCKKILEEGEEVENRTGINTITIPDYFKFNLEEEFPFLTTKKLFYRRAILEMLWIYQVQSNDVRWLQDRGVHIWDKWEIAEDGKWRANQNVFENGHVVKKDIVKDFGKEYAHTIGTAYGWIVREYNQMNNLIDKLKNNPTDRRKVISLWQDAHLDTAVLPSCVWSSVWNVNKGHLNAWVNQRSCDVPLGLPFNVTQYSVLLYMLAHVCGLKPGTLNWEISDAHIYVDQIDGIKEQIRRGEELEDLPAPELWLNPEVKDFYDFDNSKDLKDIKVLKYKHHGKIDFPLSQ